MTSVCVGGAASHPKPGVAEAVIIGAGSLAAVLGPTSNPYLIALAGLLGTFEYETISFCAGEPPTMPTMSDAEWAAIFTWGDVVAHNAALAKVDAIIGNVAWYAFCECTSGAQPTPPATPTAGTGAPDPHGITTGSPGTPGGDCTDSTPITHTLPGTLTTEYSVNVPTGALTYTLTASTTQTTAPFYGQAATNMVFRDRSAGNILQATPDFFSNHGAPSFTVTRAIPANAGWMEMQFSSTPIDGAHSMTARVVIDGNCLPAGGGPLSRCCPPDETMMGLLQQIVSLLTLVQRQSVPFAYVPGSSHTGLTGSGEIAVQGILGLSVECTTLPASLGLQIGDPNVLFDVGWINVGTADGWKGRRRITANPFLVDGLLGDITLIGYSLTPGVVANIRELVREP